MVAVLLTGAAVYYHRTITPPDCTDPDTLALVHASLTDHFKLPETTRLENIQTIAGGYLAFRYVCKAQLAGFDRHALPPGTPIPDKVSYVSDWTEAVHWTAAGRLTNGERQHEVSVRIAPLMILEQVE